MADLPLASETGRGTTPHPIPFKDLDVYNIKFEISLKEATETIQGKSILTHIIEHLKSNKNDTEFLFLYDVTKKEIPNDLDDIPSEDFPKRFCFETIGNGKFKRIVFGMTVHSTIPYATLKERAIPYLQDHDIFMKSQQMGFDYGAHWVSIGFIIGLHPTFGELEKTAATIRNDFGIGWNAEPDYWTDDKKDALTDEFKTASTLELTSSDDIPITILPNVFTGRNKNGMTSRTLAAAVMVPYKLEHYGNEIMDFVWLQSKMIPQYVPISYRDEDPDEFYEIVKQHDAWMSNHRNIQVNNVPENFHFEHMTAPGMSITLCTLLTDHIPHVLSVKYDKLRKRVNVSVIVENYINTIDKIEEELKKCKFAFNPTVMRPRKARKTTANTIGQDGKSVYANALAYLKTDRQTKPEYTRTVDATPQPKTTRTNAWFKSPVPMMINFTDVTEHFPELPTQTKKTPPSGTRDNSSTTTPTTRNTNPKEQGTNGSTLTGSTLEKTLSDMQTALSRYEKEVNDLKSTITNILQNQQSSNVAAALTQLQQQNEENKRQNEDSKKQTEDMAAKLILRLDAQDAANAELKAEVAARDAKMDRILAIFETQQTQMEQAVTLYKRPAQQEETFERVQKKTIKPRDFNTPEKAPRPVGSPNRYELLDNDEENEEDDEDDGDNSTSFMNNAWEDDLEETAQSGMDSDTYEQEQIIQHQHFTRSQQKVVPERKKIASQSIISRLNRPDRSHADHQLHKLPSRSSAQRPHSGRGSGRGA